MNVELQALLRIENTLGKQEGLLQSLDTKVDNVIDRQDYTNGKVRELRVDVDGLLTQKQTSAPVIVHGKDATVAIEQKTFLQQMTWERWIAVATALAIIISFVIERI